MAVSGPITDYLVHYCYFRAAPVLFVCARAHYTPQHHGAITSTASLFDNSEALSVKRTQSKTQDMDVGSSTSIALWDCQDEITCATVSFPYRN